MNINFDDGFIKLKINGDEDRVLRWNPNDINFIDRFINFQEWINSSEFVELTKSASSGDFSMEDGKLNIKGYTHGDIIKMGEQFNSKLDELFNANVSGAAFCGVNPLTPTKSGFMFGGFIEAITPVISESFESNSKGMDKYINASNQNKKHLKGK